MNINKDWSINVRKKKQKRSHCLENPSWREKQFLSYRNPIPELQREERGTTQEIAEMSPTTHLKPTTNPTVD